MGKYMIESVNGVKKLKVSEPLKDYFINFLSGKVEGPLSELKSRRQIDIIRNEGESVTGFPQCIEIENGALKSRQYGEIDFPFPYLFELNTSNRGYYDQLPFLGESSSQDNRAGCHIFLNIFYDFPNIKDDCFSSINLKLFNNFEERATVSRIVKKYNPKIKIGFVMGVDRLGLQLSELWVRPKNSKDLEREVNTFLSTKGAITTYINDLNQQALERAEQTARKYYLR